MPFSWNPVPGPVPPRPYHEHGYSEFHQVGKTNNNKGDDERESQPPAAAAPSVQRAPDDEDLNESETKEDDGDREEVKSPPRMT